MVHRQEIVDSIRYNSAHDPDTDYSSQYTLDGLISLDMKLWLLSVEVDSFYRRTQSCCHYSYVTVILIIIILLAATTK